MNRKQKVLLIIGPMTMSFIYAMTHPVVQIYFMRLVSSDILAIADMVSTGSIVVLIGGSVSIQTAITLQCLANLLMGLTDIKAYKCLQ